MYTLTFLDCNARDQTIFMAFHNLHYIVPSKCSVKKKTWTPTISESREAFLRTVKNSNAISIEMKKYKAIFDGKGIADHPIIIEVNDSKTRNYNVAVCRTIYNC